jgi:hypothetical protein
MSARAFAKPAIAYCETGRRLLEAVGDAVSELAALQNEQLEATINGEPKLQLYDDRMRKAKAVKEERKRAFLTHVQEHGC